MKTFELIQIAVTLQLIFVISVAIAATSHNTPIFTQNCGQWDRNVLFRSQGTGELTWLIERDGFTIVYSVPDREVAPLEDGFELNRRGTWMENEPENYPRKGHS